MISSITKNLLNKNQSQLFTNNFKTLQSHNIKYGVKLTKPYNKFTDYEFEKFAYKNLIKEYRKKHFNEHWQRQTLVENQFIEEYNKQQEEKAKRVEEKFRTSICKIAIATQKQIKGINVKKQKKSDKLKKFLLEQDVNRMNRRRIVQMLNQESLNWYNEENLNKLKDETLIPNYIYDETDYYLKLHEEALLYSIGDFDGLEELQSENKYIKYKNKLLMPIYQDIVSLVKHMKNTDISKLNKEFSVARALIDKEYSDISQILEKENQLNLLQQSYSVLRKQTDEKLSKEEVPNMHKHLLQLYNLLDQWLQYTTIVKMSNSVAEQLIQQEEQKYDVYSSANKDDANTFEESLKSASEHETSDNEEDIDLMKYEQTEEQRKQDQKDLKNMVDEFSQKEKQGDQFDSILSSLESDEVNQQIDQDFEKQLQKKQYKQESDFNLGEGYEKLEDAEQLYKGIDLDNVFPRILINSVTDYQAVLKYSNLEEIKKYEEGQEILLKDMRGKSKKLQTSIICQVYSDRVQELKEQNSSNKKVLHQLGEIEQLLTLISEQQINEPQFLFKVWETYGN